MEVRVSLLICDGSYSLQEIAELLRELGRAVMTDLRQNWLEVCREASQAGHVVTVVSLPRPDRYNVQEVTQLMRELGFPDTAAAAFTDNAITGGDVLQLGDEELAGDLGLSRLQAFQPFIHRMHYLTAVRQHPLLASNLGLSHLQV